MHYRDVFEESEPSKHYRAGVAKITEDCKSLGFPTTAARSHANRQAGQGLSFQQSGHHIIGI